MYRRMKEQNQKKLHKSTKKKQLQESEKRRESHYWPFPPAATTETVLSRLTSRTRRQKSHLSQGILRND